MNFSKAKELREGDIIWYIEDREKSPVKQEVLWIDVDNKRGYVYITCTDGAMYHHNAFTEADG